MVPDHFINSCGVNFRCGGLFFSNSRISGPYVKDDENKTYGHVAIRIVALNKDYTYDYGRYGVTRGTFNDEGDGIIRIWSSFSKYIVGENSTVRKSVGYVFSIKDEGAIKVFEHYNEFIKGPGVVTKSKLLPSLEVQDRLLI